MKKPKTANVVFLDYCDSCGQVLQEEWDFCPYCRSKVETCDCIFCREKIKVNWNFCPHCQHKATGPNPAGQSFDDGNKWLKTILTAPPRG